MVQPLINQGLNFQGLGSIGNNEEQVGIITLLFSIPNGAELNNLEIPQYSDEGTQSQSFWYHGTLYIIIPLSY
jgi:hypothetical protein